MAIKEKPYFDLMDIMQRKGITQLELSERINMNRNTLNLKLWGKHALKLEEAKNIAKALDIDVERVN